MTTKQELSHSEQQAKSQLESIIEMVLALEKADPGTEEYDDAHAAIHEDPLDVSIRTGWYAPGPVEDEPVKPEEFCILLCTGGPACRLIGDLDQHGEPSEVRIEHQDWGTPWTEYRMTSEQHGHVLSYCRQFYFGE